MAGGEGGGGEGAIEVWEQGQWPSESPPHTHTHTRTHATTPQRTGPHTPPHTHTCDHSQAHVPVVLPPWHGVVVEEAPPKVPVGVPLHSAPLPHQGDPRVVTTPSRTAGGVWSFSGGRGSFIKPELGHWRTGSLGVVITRQSV